MKKPRLKTTTYREPYAIDYEYTFGGFNLLFSTTDKNGDIHRAKIVLHFCDVGELARVLWRAIKERQNKINTALNAMRGESQ